MNTDSEIWQPVRGYETSYEVSDRGRVRSLNRTDSRGCSRKGNMLKPQSRKSSRPYLYITLGHNDKRPVHRLVLEAFVGPCPPAMECLHDNDDPTDNQLSNLSWGTRSKNKLDAVRNRRHNHANKTHCLRGHEFTLSNTYITTKGSRQCRQCLRLTAMTRNSLPHLGC